MDREIVEAVRTSNQACMTLMTLMMEENGKTLAGELVSSDPLYSEPAVCMAVATFALAAINTLAIELGVEPEVLVQTAALSAAEYAISLDKMVDDDNNER